MFQPPSITWPPVGGVRSITNETDTGNPDIFALFTAWENKLFACDTMS